MFKFARFVLLRAWLAMMTLAIVSFIVFNLMELVPGNCAERYVAYKNTQGQGITKEDIRAEKSAWGSTSRMLCAGSTGCRASLRVVTLANRACGGLGVNQLVGQEVPIVPWDLPDGVIFAYLIAIPVGIISATADNPFLNNSLRFVSYLGLAMPNFLLALMIMLFSTVVFGDSLTGSARNSGTLPGRTSA